MAPQADWICLNNDGCEGILQEAYGNWIHGFSYNLGSCNVVETKMWGILQSLRLAWSLSYIGVY